MKIITSSQFQEYQDLKRWAEREKVLVAARDVKNLEDDIDLPIRKVVAGMALLGLRPQFSCCGFDYAGQPYHKYHQYDRPYVVCYPSDCLPELFPSNPWYGWKVSPHIKGTIKVEFETIMNPSWRSRDCIHSVEECVLGVQSLENYIVFLCQNLPIPDSIVIEDTNANYPKFWQYPAKSAWHVTKEYVTS